MKPRFRLLKKATRETVVQNLHVADRFWSRFRGLQCRRSFPVGSGLLLVPCSSIHTFFMRFPIDVAFLDDQGVVVAVRSNLKPWRVVLPVAGAHAALEMAASSGSMNVGEVLELEVVPPPCLNPHLSLGFLCRK